MDSLPEKFPSPAELLQENRKQRKKAITVLDDIKKKKNKMINNEEIDVLLQVISTSAKNDINFHMHLLRQERLITRTSQDLIETQRKLIELQDKNFHNSKLNGKPNEFGKKSFAQVVKELAEKQIKQSSKASLVMTDSEIEKQDTSKVAESYKYKIDQILDPYNTGAKIVALKHASNGGVKMSFNSRAEMETANALLKKHNCVTFIPAKRLPQLFLENPIEAFSAEKLIVALADQNKELRHINKNNSKIYIRKTNKGFVISCTPDIYCTITIKMSGFVFLGNQRCRLRPYVDLCMCYNCCRFGHKAEQCKSRTCCRYCSSIDHDSQNCQFSKATNLWNCVNCKRNGIEECQHAAFQFKSCPVATAMKKVIEEDTDWKDILHSP